MHDDVDTQIRATFEQLYPSLDDVPPDWDAIVAAADVRRRARRPAEARPFRIAAAAGTAAAIALVLISTLPGNGPPAASAVERAEAALAAPRKAILHTVTRTVTYGRAGRETGTTETWQLMSAPFDSREVSRGREIGTVNGRPVAYIAASDTIVTLAPGAEAREPEGPSDEVGRLRDVMVRLLRSGQAREAGRVTIDGREGIRIVSSANPLQMVVDARTYRPLEWETVSDNGIRTTTRFETYEWLPATRANRALLSIRAQHPNATVRPGGITIDPDPPGKGN
jgi:hypothetical protein